MKLHSLFIGIIIIFGIIIIGCTTQTVINDQRVGDNQQNNTNNNVTEQQKKLDEQNNKYIEDIKYCEFDEDCIFHPGLCQAINQYYETEPMKPGAPACNLAQCGAICVENKCKIDFSCLQKETELNCDNYCKSKGFVFGFCRYGNSESKTELECSDDMFGVENQVCIGQTNDCNHFDERPAMNMYYISSCCCIPECIPDGQLLNNVDSDYCCSKETHDVATACDVNPENGEHNCSYTTFCGTK